MPERGIRSTYSQCPLQIFICDKHGIIGTGSAFFYTIAHDWFLITNWHNVTGMDIFTKKPLFKKRIPEFIKVKLSSYITSNVETKSKEFTTISQHIEIYKDKKPLWFEYPDSSTSCDVIALPLHRSSNCPEFMHNAANRISDLRIPINPGCPVFIIGFPRSISIAFGLPIWKSGYIASEPHYDITIGGQPSDIGGLIGGKNLPAFFIDSQTREGMSGSPVFASYTGNWDLSDPYKSIDWDNKEIWQRDDIILWDTRMEFIGCYSGRIGANEQQAALGLCWRKDVIHKICSVKVRAKNPHNYT